MERARQAEETRLQSKVFAELTRVTVEASTTYQSIDPTIAEHADNLRKILEPSMKRMGSTAAQMARDMYAQPLADSLGQPNALQSQAELDAAIAKVARERAGQRASDISETTRTRIANAVARGLEANETPDEISRTIVDEVGDMDLARARTIARTETAVAMQTGQYMEMESASENLGVTLTKTWMATEDERTRDTHLEADGQTVAMDEPFIVGESELMYPSDPEGPAEEVINCRCAVLYNPE